MRPERLAGAGDVLIDNDCSHTMASGETSFTCDVYAVVPGTLVPGNNVQVYPRVLRSPGIVEHDGAGNPSSYVSIPIVGDDAFEKLDVLREEMR